MYRLISPRTATAVASRAACRLLQRQLPGAVGAASMSTLLTTNDRNGGGIQQHQHSNLIFKNNNYEEDTRRITQLDFAADEQYVATLDIEDEEDEFEVEEDDELLESHPYNDDPKPAYFESSIHSHFPSILDESQEFPNQVFEIVDEDDDGLINEKEFEKALQHLHYEEIKTMQKVRFQGENDELHYVTSYTNTKPSNCVIILFTSMT